MSTGYLLMIREGDGERVMLSNTADEDDMDAALEHGISMASEVIKRGQLIARIVMMQDACIVKEYLPVGDGWISVDV